MATAAATTLMSPTEYVRLTTAERAETDTTASDEWFETNAIDGTPRNVVGAGQGLGGLINMASGLFHTARGAAHIAESTLPIGVNQVSDSIRSFAEAKLVESKTAKEAKESAQLMKALAITSVLPFAALAVASSTPWILGAIAAAAVGYYRYKAAVSVEKQVDIVSHPESVTASESYFENNRGAIRLPRKMRNIERFIEYAKSLGYGFATLATVFTNPAIGLLMGVATWYSFWKAHNVIPPIADYYDRMGDRTEAILDEDED